MLFSTLEIASLPLFPPFYLPHFGSFFYIPSTSNNKVRKPTGHGMYAKNHLVLTNKRTGYQKKNTSQHVRSGCFFYNWKDVTTKISCLNLYSSCIKKVINPDGRRKEFSAVIYTTRRNVRPSERQIRWFSELLLGFSSINLDFFTFSYISFQIQILR